jgi:DNA-binding SARP family transcriptional activator
MEFRMLGPLDVERGDRPLRLGARRERAVLALLLLQPNAAVSVDTLVNELWPTSAPTSALHSVHVAISRLRQLLDADGPPRIRTRRPGYALRVEPGELDVELFERCVAEGERHWRAGDAAAASRLIADGLALWRGAPLADLSDEPFVVPVAVRLEAARLSALELRIEADLALGRAASLVGELEDLSTAHPLREHLRSQLMRALAASGRQSEALRVYRDTRALLVEDLGVEPGAALQDVHRRVLAGELEPTPGDLRPHGVASHEYDVVPRDERKIVTVVYVDWAPAPDVLDDPELLRRSNREFAALVGDAVGRTGGVVEEQVGTAVLASFGATPALEDHAQRAARAGLEIRGRSRGWLPTGGSLRIGISSGEVVVGVDRAGHRTISGEAVVGAAQLEQSGRAGQIRVSDRTWRLARRQFMFSPVVADPPPGANPSTRSVRLLERETDQPVERLSPDRTIIGRREELHVLSSLLERVQQGGRPHVVTVCGEAGVGKTRLVRAFVADAMSADKVAPVILTGHCLAYGRGITYWPLAEILRDHLELSETDDADTVLARLPDREILGLTLGLDVAPDLHPLAAQQRLQAAWVSLVEEMGQKTGCVVWVVEDVHWAEPPLLDLLDRLVADARASLLVVCTGRPEVVEVRPGGVGGSRGSSLWLEPLSYDQSRALATSVLGSDPPPELEPVLRRAEGNPFFVEELLASLIDRGVLANHSTVWSLTGPLDDVTVPDTVRGTLASRVDLLPPAERATLQAASVGGREFSADAVSQMLHGLDADYRRLIEREFVLRIPSPDGTHTRFTFKHALTREVVYNGIGREARADLHGCFAEWLDDNHHTDEFAPLLAHHFAQAVQPADLVDDDAARSARNDVLTGKAVRWLRRAGELAIGRHSIDEGLALLHRALELEPERQTQVRLWHAIGRGHAVRYDGLGCWQALQRAVELATDPGEQADIYSELALQTVTRYAMLNPMPARELVDDWVAKALSHAPDGSPARARALAARAMWFAPDPGQAAENAHQAAADLGDVEVLDHAFNAQALAAFIEGRYIDAQTWASRRLELLDSISDPDVIVDIYSAMIPGLLGVGDFVQAHEYAQLHDEAASRLSAHHRVHAVAMRLEVDELTGGWPGCRDRQPADAVRPERAFARVRRPRKRLMRRRTNCEGLRVPGQGRQHGGIRGKHRALAPHVGSAPRSGGRGRCPVADRHPAPTGEELVAPGHLRSTARRGRLAGPRRGC